MMGYTFRIFTLHVVLCIGSHDKNREFIPVHGVETNNML